MIMFVCNTKQVLILFAHFWHFSMFFPPPLRRALESNNHVLLKCRLPKYSSLTDWWNLIYYKICEIYKILQECETALTILIFFWSFSIFCRFLILSLFLSLKSKGSHETSLIKLKTVKKSSWHHLCSLHCSFPLLMFSHV